MTPRQPAKKNPLTRRALACRKSSRIRLRRGSLKIDVNITRELLKCLIAKEVDLAPHSRGVAAMSGRRRRRQRRGQPSGDRHAVRRARRRPGHGEQSQFRQHVATRRSAPARRPVPTLPGTDAVHTHMTNTRLTDPEVLELRYPRAAGRFPRPHRLRRTRQVKRRRRHPPHHTIPRTGTI
jgi:hypothetical protein